MTFTVAGITSSAEECKTASAVNNRGALRRCQRCPELYSDTDYVIAMVANSASSSCELPTLSEAVLLPIHTLDITPPSFLTMPYTSGATVDSFQLSLALNEPGVAFYVVALAEMLGKYMNDAYLQYSTLPLIPQEVVNIAQGGGAAARFLQGVVDAGNMTFVAGGQLQTAIIQPQCVPAVCTLLQNSNGPMLSPNTKYNVYIVAADTAGNLQLAQDSQTGDMSRLLMLLSYD